MSIIIQNYFKINSWRISFFLGVVHMQLRFTFRTKLFSHMVHFEVT